MGEKRGLGLRERVTLKSRRGVLWQSGDSEFKKVASKQEYDKTGSERKGG